MKAVIDRRVVDDMEYIIGLAKKKRKVLNKKDISALKAIDANEVWTLLNHYTLKLRTSEVPFDIMRMIFLYLPAKEYYRIASALNHKFRDQVHKDVCVIKFSIDYRNKCYNVYYPNRITYPYSFTFSKTPQNVSYQRRKFYLKNGSKDYKGKLCFTVELKLNGSLDNYLDRWKEIYIDNEMILRKYSTGFEYVTKKISQIELESFWKNPKGKIFNQFTSPKSSVYDHAKIIISSPITQKNEVFMYVEGKVIEYDITRIGW
jgi:hypothetical protein